MKQLGKLEKIEDLRSIWKHEAKDFTPWLAEEENLSMLSEAIGIDIVLEEQESTVGEFSVDIFATEESTGRKASALELDIPERPAYIRVPVRIARSEGHRFQVSKGTSLFDTCD